RQGIGKPRIFIKAGRQPHRIFEPDTPEYPFQAGVFQAKLLFQETAARGGPDDVLETGDHPIVHLLRIKTEQNFLNKGIHAAKIADRLDYCGTLSSLLPSRPPSLSFNSCTYSSNCRIRDS